ncbi:auxin-responsive protein IAA18-like isoform X2 [Andrographis paniculata]|uniref:auxin-responsive protein IAA18-like isoform X2 n=1 Tax=Andrographis paniculata TaxID=175694 RepID=UPI0021E89B86|nr:auxin-responsive protein IAA18-like isoform X2 [Andrographis paniculata]
MEDYPRKHDDAGCHHFFDLVRKDTEWTKTTTVKEEDDEYDDHDTTYGSPKLDLCLGPPSADHHQSVFKPPWQKRTAAGPVVGWPPVRSFRKNLATGNSSKMVSESISGKVSDRKAVESCPKGRFVKINMDGIPIGRKVDLKAYDSYEKLSYAVDELFHGLIAAQRDSSIKVEDMKRSLVNKNGEYTLVYEDNEGDRMLVGDVPWQ